MTPISVCVIVKNEEKHIESFLRALRKGFMDYPAEIIIVDTGSTDNTKDIASSMVCRVFSFEWCNDFSKARNYSVSLATNDYVLILDADEYISDIDTSCFDTFKSCHPYDIGTIKCINKSDDGNSTTDKISRFFNKNYYNYSGIVHEQVTSLTDRPTEYIDLPISVNHVGYSGTMDEKKKKAMRNIALLEMMPYENDPYALFQIGQSYYIINEYEKASSYFSKALEFDLDTKLDYVQTMVLSYGYSLLECDRIEEALSYESIYDEFADTAEFTVLMGLIYLRAGFVAEAAREFTKATSFSTCRINGSNSYVPNFNLGCIYEILGNITEAKSYFEKCGNYSPAISHLESLK